MYTACLTISLITSFVKMYLFKDRQTRNAFLCLELYTYNDFYNNYLVIYVLSVFFMHYKKQFQVLLITVHGNRAGLYIFSYH